MTNQLNQQLAALFKSGLATEEEILDNVEAIHGLVYARKVLAVVDLIYTFSQTNEAICGEIPKEVVAALQAEQGSAIGNLIANLLGSKEDAPLDEFMKVVKPLMNRRIAAKEKARALMTKHLGDAGHD